MLECMEVGLKEGVLEVVGSLNESILTSGRVLFAYSIDCRGGFYYYSMSIVNLFLLF